MKEKSSFLKVLLLCATSIYVCLTFVLHTSYLRGTEKCHESSLDRSTPLKDFVAIPRKQSYEDELVLPGVLLRPRNNALLPFKTMPEDILPALDMILMGRNKTRATFIQVGANDGQLFDPIYPHLKKSKARWIGLQVEPQPINFAKVSILHADALDWSFYHGAMVSTTKCQKGKIPFCEAKASGMSRWFRNQGQENTVNVNSSMCASDEFQIVMRPCISSFESLIQNHASQAFREHVWDIANNKFHVDLLVVDVEGFESDVLELIQWVSFSPHCIYYEHKHVPVERNKENVRLLKKNNYTVVQLEFDTLSCRVHL